MTPLMGPMATHEVLPHHGWKMEHTQAEGGEQSGDSICMVSSHARANSFHRIDYIIDIILAHSGGTDPAQDTSARHALWNRIVVLLHGRGKLVQVKKIPLDSNKAVRCKRILADRLRPEFAARRKTSKLNENMTLLKKERYLNAKQSESAFCSPDGDRKAGSVLKVHPYDRSVEKHAISIRAYDGNLHSTLRPSIPIVTPRNTPLPAPHGGSLSPADRSNEHRRLQSWGHVQRALLEGKVRVRFTCRDGAVCTTKKRRRKSLDESCSGFPGKKRNPPLTIKFKVDCSSPMQTSTTHGTRERRDAGLGERMPSQAVAGGSSLGLCKRKYVQSASLDRTRYAALRRTTGDDSCPKAMRIMGLHKGDSVEVLGCERRSLSLVSSLSATAVRNHIDDTRREVRVYRMRRLVSCLQKLMEHTRNYKGVFNHPVDPAALNLPTYFDVVKEPMDLGTVKARLEMGVYSSVADFKKDVNLVFDNAILFNPAGHYVHEAARALKKVSTDLLNAAASKMKAEVKQAKSHSCDKCLGQQCIVCTANCQEFMHYQLQCSGTCGQPIRKGVSFYQSRDGAKAWCVRCYGRLGRKSGRSEKAKGEEGANAAEIWTHHSYGEEGSNIEGKSKSFPDESDLKAIGNGCVGAKKLRAISTPESWVKCDKCRKWLHQICGLFNPVEDRETGGRLEFICPLCQAERLECDNESVKKEVSDATGTGPSKEPDSTAAPMKNHQKRDDELPLPKCRMSDFMERKLREELHSQGVTELPDSLRIRVVSSTKAQTKVFKVVRESVFNAGSGANCSVRDGGLDDDSREADSALGKLERYPEVIDYDSKAVYVFQRQDGMDICIFAMYVQEYDDNCGIVANRRRVYIAYIDSVRYLRPRANRTLVYHVILMAYLDYARSRGFSHAHIWACPPQRSVNYIFWGRPFYQRTPGVEQLRSWYWRMLEFARERGIVKHVSNFYEAHFLDLSDTTTVVDSASTTVAQKRRIRAASVSSSSSSRHSYKRVTEDDMLFKWPEIGLPPYFDGDLWPAEAERVVTKAMQQNGAKKGKTEGGKRSTSFGCSSDVPDTDRDKTAAGQMTDTLSESTELIGRATVPRAEFDVENHLKAVKTMRAAADVIKLKKDDMFVVELNCDKPVSALDLSKDRQEGSRVFVDTRQAFHLLCAFNNYQFDTKRRAKHSTMMLLYHLRNLGVSFKQSFCTHCRSLLLASQLWRCSECPGFILCDGCEAEHRIASMSEADGVSSRSHVRNHSHPLVLSSSK